VRGYQVDGRVEDGFGAGDVDGCFGVYEGLRPVAEGLWGEEAACVGR
jgi:hypothetical protein